MLHIHAWKRWQARICKYSRAPVFNLGFFIDSTVLCLATFSAPNICCGSQFLSENFPLCSLPAFSATPSSSLISAWSFAPLAQIKMDDASTLCPAVQRWSHWSPGDGRRHLALIKLFVARGLSGGRTIDQDLSVQLSTQMWTEPSCEFQCLTLFLALRLSVSCSPSLFSYSRSGGVSLQLLGWRLKSSPRLPPPPSRHYVHVFAPELRASVPRETLRRRMCGEGYGLNPQPSCNGIFLFMTQMI